MVYFTNQPKLSEHEVDQKFNERRLALIPHIESFFDTHILFREKEVYVEFSHLGVSSQVCIAKAGEEKYVLKIPLRPSAEGEGLFLKKWEEAGVSVPHIFDSGRIGGHPFILMGFVDAPLLSSVIKSAPDAGEFRYEMGKTLALMHKPAANGYGQLIDGKPEYSSFREWVSGAHMRERIQGTQDLALLGEEHGPIGDAIEMLASHSERASHSSYCHFDFAGGNIMATKPLTVIDPNFAFNDGVMDLGMSLLLIIAGGATDGIERFKEGYRDGGADPSNQVIQAAIILAAHMKFVYWKAKKKDEQIERVREYLVQTSYILRV